MSGPPLDQQVEATAEQIAAMDIRGAAAIAAAAAGKEISAVIKETRPHNQGHITARELRALGVDVMPPRYVEAIITERGQFPPESIVILLRELFGESAGEPWEDPAVDRRGEGTKAGYGDEQAVDGVDP